MKTIMLFLATLLSGIAHGYDIGLAWDYPLPDSAGIRGFRLYRSRDGLPFEVVATSEAGRNFIRDTGLNDGSTYTYEVTAVSLADPAVESDPSNQVAYLPQPRLGIGPGAVLSVHARQGNVYAVEYNTDVASPLWFPMLQVTAAADDFIITIPDNVLGLPHVFFRLRKIGDAAMVPIQARWQR